MTAIPGIPASVRRLFFLSLLVLAASIRPVRAQESVLIVERCKALSLTSPIHNVWVDPDNVKWVANREGLFQVLALDLVKPVSVPAGRTSLLTIRGGNANIDWSTSEMAALLRGATISTASYDPKTKTVWVGTLDDGVYQFTLEPLAIRQQLNAKNRKLAANQVNDIHIAQNGTIWIATIDGMVTGDGDKWTTQERYLNFIAVDTYGDNLWILGDNFLWQVDAKGKWLPMAIEPRYVEGTLRDIAVDARGRVWIASNIMTGYNAETKVYQRFGPGQYFTSQFVNCLDVDKDGSIWTGTDDKGLYLIQWEDAMTVNVLMSTPPDCKSKNPTAALNVRITGGQPPRTIAWSTGASEETISGLAPGEYSVTVTDGKGIVKSAKYEVPVAGVTAKVELVAVSKGGNDGQANCLTDGGTGKLTYAWDNGEKSQLATKLPAGTHRVTVTDESGCTAVASIEMQETIGILSVKIEQNAGKPSCQGDLDVALTAVPAGGKPPYAFAWSGSLGNKEATKATRAGAYAVTVTDAAGQSVVANVELAGVTPLSVTTSVLKPASANGRDGEAAAVATGGQEPYRYAWSTDAAGTSAKALEAGIHSVTVTDANGCTAVTEMRMTENITALTASLRQTAQLLCNGNASARLEVTAEGGKSPYSYAWNSGFSGAASDNLKAGSYVVTVTDAAGNTQIATLDVTEPQPLTLTVAAEGAASTRGSDGKAMVRASGGTGKYTYAWDNGETGSRATKLPAGKHTVTVTDDNGCQATAEVEVTENILALSITVKETAPVQCTESADGSITASVSGGKDPYAFAWNHGATTADVTGLRAGEYAVTVTDAAGQSASATITLRAPEPLAVDIRIDAPASTNTKDGKASVTARGGSGKYNYAWDTGETSAKATTLPGGRHTVTVTDGNGCTVTGEVTIPENILPLAVRIETTGTIKCSGQATGALQSDISGGKPPYTLAWSGPRIGTGESLADLGPGVYELAVTDAAGNRSTATVELTSPSPLAASVADISPASTGNADGRVTLKITGGTPPYAHDGGPVSQNANHMVSKLAPGKQRIRITDANGCFTDTEVEITENILPLTVTIQQTQPIRCAGSAEAGLEALPRGGKSPYSYSWSNGRTGSQVNGLPAGAYAVTVTDAAGQSSQVSFKVSGPEPLQVSASNLRPATNDRIDDGKATVIAKGGVGAYTIEWNSGETGPSAAKLPLGDGRVRVTDGNGCMAEAVFTIAQKVMPELTASRLASGEPIRMEKIQLEADSINLNEEAIPSLDELFGFLYDNPTIAIEVSGHTNGLPADDYCDRISAERAETVANYLIEKGIEARRIVAKGYGKRKPIATNQTPEGRRRNQRVEIRLIQITE